MPVIKLSAKIIQAVDHLHKLDKIKCFFVLKMNIPDVQLEVLGYKK